MICKEERELGNSFYQTLRAIAKIIALGTLTTIGLPVALMASSWMGICVVLVGIGICYIWPTLPVHHILKPYIELSIAYWVSCVAFVAWNDSTVYHDHTNRSEPHHLVMRRTIQDKRGLRPK